MHALTFDAFGGPEVLRLTEASDPSLLPGTAIVRMKAVGLNFADIYRRRGDYHLEGKAPFILGYEGAGVVEAVQPGAGEDPLLRVGDRVAFADVPHANAELVRAPLTHLVPLPEGVTFRLAAATLLQGLTAHYLVNDSHPVRPGELAVVHAAAGGVGLLLTQLIKLRGGTVFALASSREKAAAAERAGADHVASYSEDWVTRVRESAGERGGADVAYDAVGTTVAQSLAAVRRGGHVVFYGMAGGDPPLVNPRQLMDESKTLSGGDLWNVLTSRAERVRRAGELFSLLLRGELTASISKTFTLARGGEAHAFLESRKSIGKVLLVLGEEPEAEDGK